jgi:hypothetical protein
MKSNLSSTFKFRGCIKKLIKFFLYSILFSIILYFTTWVIAYLIIENHKIDMDDIMSMESYDEIFQE